ncbi:hypothetical protein ACTWP5_23920 [Streptomyces sp. 4N509B]|uniref:hypothetical protein n=1 Tax=Streptomyces sp. 4N509B TaxID=3457413 RepID=UPI003FD196C7
MSASPPGPGARNGAVGAPETLDALDALVERLSDRLRALPESALRRGAAARGLALARELARRAHRLEPPDPTRPALPAEPGGSALPAEPGESPAPAGAAGGPSPRERELPDAGIYAVGDQLAVAGHDLVEALRAAPPGPDAEAELSAALALLGSQRF